MLRGTRGFLDFLTASNNPRRNLPYDPGKEAVHILFPNPWEGRGKQALRLGEKKVSPTCFGSYKPIIFAITIAVSRYLIDRATIAWINYWLKIYKSNQTNGRKTRKMNHKPVNDDCIIYCSFQTVIGLKHICKPEESRTFSKHLTNNIDVFLYYSVSPLTWLDWSSLSINQFPLGIFQQLSTSNVIIYDRFKSVLLTLRQRNSSG